MSDQRPPEGPDPSGGGVPVPPPPPYVPPTYVPPATPGPAPHGQLPARRRSGLVIVAIAAVFVLIAAITATVLVVRSTSSSAGEVFLDAADQPGPDPFTTEVTVDPLASTTSTAAPSTTTGSGGITATVGSKPGLYGGTQDNGRCDASQLVSFLRSNPDKASAWVAALDGDPTLHWTGGTQVSVDQIPAYVDELTPLTLTADTRVTNYGYSRGKPTARQAVLQRGTAVLVDAYGVPRAKCGCGNPLTKPAAVKSTPAYQGTPWPGWSPTTVVVVQQTTQVVNTFVIVNLSGSGYLDRPAGSDGSQDTVSTYTGDGTAPTTAVPTTSTTAPPSTLPAADFCAQFQALQTKWTGASGDTAAQRAELAADFDTLTAAAPAEVKADMQTINAWVHRVFGSGDFYLNDIPADVQAAENRVTTYLENVCGIVVN